MGIQNILAIFAVLLGGLNVVLAQSSLIEGLQLQCPSLQCQQFEKNLRSDSVNCTPSLETTFTNSVRDDGVQVTGDLLYFSLVRSPYHYDVYPSARGGQLIGVRIAVEGPTPKQLDELRAIVRLAEGIWNIYAPYGMQFSFQLFDSSQKVDVHFRVRFTTKLSVGPYNEVWSSQWASITVAHEIGHMMGLNDEYDFAGITHKCDTVSLMCSLGGVPAAYHYYLVARRVHCQDKEFSPLGTLSEYLSGINAHGVDL